MNETSELNNEASLEQNNEIIEELRIDRKTKARINAGFWKRLFAFLLDNILLAIFGVIIGLFFGSVFNKMGPWARLVGLFAIMLYFGIYNSEIGHGQTFAKRLFKIRVVDSNMSLVSLRRSLLRTFLLFIPTYLGDLILPFMKVNLIHAIVSFITYGVRIGLIYLYIFNRNTRQSLHDVLCGTYVVEERNDGSLKTGKIARIHYAIIAIFLVLSIITPILFNFKMINKLAIDMNKMKELQERIDSDPTIRIESINEGVNNFNGKKSTYLSINFYWSGNPDESMDIAKKVSGIALDTYTDAKYKDVIRINIIKGYDIGIVKKNSFITYDKLPSEWKE